LDMDLHTAMGGTADTILTEAPDLLTLLSTSSLTQSQAFLGQALDSLAGSINSALAETGDQSNDLLVIAPADREGAQRSLIILDLLAKSLRGTVTFSADLGLPQSERLDLSLLFSGRFSTLRAFLPPTNQVGDLNVSAFPDPTFGGSVPDVTQEDIDAAIPHIRDFFHQLRRALR